MERPVGANNRLLAVLPPADFGLLAPDIQKISLEQGEVLLRPGDRIERVYFPHSGAIAFMLDMPNGQTVATALIGREGAVGMLSVLEPTRAPMAVVVRAGGIASQVSASRFHAAFVRSRAIRHIVKIHTVELLAQLQHTAACNALHCVESRMAKWLLCIHDRIDGEVISLTHEALSQLLGVRRTTVTLVLHKLKVSGAIRSDRRGRIEISRSRLEEAACECYEVTRREIDRIVLPQAMMPRAHAAPTHETTGARGDLVTR